MLHAVKLVVRSIVTELIREMNIGNHTLSPAITLYLISARKEIFWSFYWLSYHDRNKIY